MSVPLSYHSFGSFEIPSKRKWIIVGTGPTADDVKEFTFGEEKEVGIVSLNAALAGIPYSTIHIVVHYEYFLQCVNYLDKPEVLFFPDPMPVGYRCLPVSAMNLLDFEFYAKEMGERLRFFEKESELVDFSLRPNALYCRDTVASTALHLLARNGVREVFFCGIDDQQTSDTLGRSRMFEAEYKIRVPNARIGEQYARRHDDELAGFLAFGKKMGVRMRKYGD